MDFCNKTASIWQVAGYALYILKIVIPIILIILGMIDFARAALSSDEKMIKDAAFKFAKRLVAAVIIFFIPTLIDVAFDLVGGFSGSIKTDYEKCVVCLTSPNGNCDTSYDGNMFE